MHNVSFFYILHKWKIYSTHWRYSWSLCNQFTTHQGKQKESQTWLDLFIIQDNQSVLQYEKSAASLIVGHDLIKIKYRLTGLITTKYSFLTRNRNAIHIETLQSETENNLKNFFLPAQNSALNFVVYFNMSFYSSPYSYSNPQLFLTKLSMHDSMFKLTAAGHAFALSSTLAE